MWLFGGFIVALGPIKVDVVEVNATALETGLRIG